jgi:hypothetical protein
MTVRIEEANSFQSKGHYSGLNSKRVSQQESTDQLFLTASNLITCRATYPDSHEDSHKERFKSIAGMLVEGGSESTRGRESAKVHSAEL